MKVIYEPLENKKGFNHLHRVGLWTDKEDYPQVDSISFVPLEKKVESILKGNPNFIAEDTELDYDEPESDNWDKVDENEDNVQIFPIDEYSDKDDVIAVQRKLNSDLKILNDGISKSKAETTVIDETKDSLKQVSEDKKETSEK